MKIGINGRFLLLPYTGIGQYTAHLLQALAEQDSSVEYVVAIPDAIPNLKFKTSGELKFSERMTLQQLSGLVGPEVAVVAELSGKNFNEQQLGGGVPEGEPAVPPRAILKFPPNVRLVLLPEKKFIPASLRKFIWEQIQVPRLFKKEKVDLAHYPYPSNPRFPGSRAPKTLVTVHDVIPWTDPKHYQPRLRSRFFQSYMKKALPKADHLICVSQTTALALSDHIQYPWGKITVIHEAASPIFSQNKPPKSPFKNPYLLYIGGYDVRKNVLRMVEAYNVYIAPTHAIDLILVGAKNNDNPYYTELKSLREILEAPTIKKPLDPNTGDHAGKTLGKIRTTDYLSPETLAQYLQNALGFVNFSLEEGFNLPLLEAAAAGTPIVTSDIAIHREILGKNALFCDPKNIKSMGETLAHFVRDSALQERLSQAARSLHSHYSWERAAQETLALYRQLAL